MKIVEEPLPERFRLAVTDIVVDPKGRLGGVVAVKHAELAGKGLTPRRRPPDAAFDEALLDELARRRIPFGLNKECIRAAVEVSAELNKHLSPEGARTRIAELLRRSRGRRRWLEK